MCLIASPCAGTYVRGIGIIRSLLPAFRRRLARLLASAAQVMITIPRDRLLSRSTLQKKGSTAWFARLLALAGRMSRP